MILTRVDPINNWPLQLNFGWNLELSSIRVLNVSPIFLPAAIFLIVTVFRIQLATYFSLAYWIGRVQFILFNDHSVYNKIKIFLKIGLYSSQIRNIDPILSIDRIYIKLLSIKKRKEHRLTVRFYACDIFPYPYKVRWKFWMVLPSFVSFKHNLMLVIDWFNRIEMSPTKFSQKVYRSEFLVWHGNKYWLFRHSYIKSDRQKGWTTFELEYSISVR